MADSNESTAGSLCGDRFFNGLTIANSIAIAGLAWYSISKMNRLEDEQEELRHKLKSAEKSIKDLKSKQVDAGAVKSELVEASERIESLEKFMDDVGDLDALGDITFRIDNIMTALEDHNIECLYTTQGNKKKRPKTKTTFKSRTSKQTSDSDEEIDIYALMDAEMSNKSKKKRRGGRWVNTKIFAF